MMCLFLIFLHPEDSLVSFDVADSNTTSVHMEKHLLSFRQEDKSLETSPEQLIITTPSLKEGNKKKLLPYNTDAEQFTDHHLHKF